MKKQSPAKQGKMSLTYTKTNKKTGKTTTNKNKFESNNSLVAPNNPNKNKIESNNSLVAPNNPNKTSIKNFLVPIGKSSGKSIIKPAVGKMKAGPFKQKKFSGFGDSVKTAVLGSVMGNKKSGKLRNQVVKNFINKPLQNMNTNDPDRPGSSGMYPTGFETKIPRINKLKKL